MPLDLILQGGDDILLNETWGTLTGAPLFISVEKLNGQEIKHWLLIDGSRHQNSEGGVTYVLNQPTIIQTKMDHIW